MSESDHIYRDLEIGKWLDRLIFAGFLALVFTGAWFLIEWVISGRL